MELVTKLRKRFNARESKVAAEQAAREADELADETAARQIAPRRGLFEGERDLGVAFFQHDGHARHTLPTPAFPGQVHAVDDA